MRRSIFYKIIGVIGLVVSLTMSLHAQGLKTGVTISYDGKLMVYTCEVNGKSVFHQSLKNAAWQWDEGKPIADLNNYLDSMSVVKDPFLSYDGLSLYFSMDKRDGNGFNIYYSSLKNKEWKEPIPLIEANTPDDEESPSLTADNRYLYFTRKPIPAKAIADDETCRRLYRMEHDVDGKWKEPEVLKITSDGCEAYPVILPDGKTLFFSSSKLPQRRKRKFDIYYVKELSVGVWDMPQLLDTLSTEANDISVAIDFQTKKIHALQIEQSRKETISKQAWVNLPMDINIPTFTVLSSTVTELDANVPIQATITIRDAYTSSVINVIENEKDGSFKLMLSNGMDYKLDYYAPLYSRYSRNYILNKTNFNYLLNDSVNLFKNVKVTLNVFDKTVFTPIDAKVISVDAANNRPLVTAENQSIVGTFIIDLPVGKNYKINIEYPGYNPYILNMDLSKDIFFNNLDGDIALIADRDSYTIKVSSAANDSLLDAHVEMLNTDISEYINPKKLIEGISAIGLRKNNSYSLTVTQKGYVFDNRMIKTGNSSHTDTINVRLIPLIKDTDIALANVKFASNTFDVTTESYGELSLLVELMIDNPEVKIEIGAYTENQGNDAFVNRLTTRQARNVADYLIMRGGITKDRITAKGYGKNPPKNINFTGATTANNPNKKAYVWFKIIEQAKDW